MPRVRDFIRDNDARLSSGRVYLRSPGLRSPRWRRRLCLLPLPVGHASEASGIERRRGRGAADRLMFKRVPPARGRDSTGPGPQQCRRARPSRWPCGSAGVTPRRIGLALPAWTPPPNSRSRFPSGSPPRLSWAARPTSSLNGDVHGCASELRVLLDAIAGCPPATPRRQRRVVSRRHDQSGARQRWRAGQRAMARGARRRPCRPADGQPRDHDAADRDRRPARPQGRGDVALQAHGRRKAAGPDARAGRPAGRARRPGAHPRGAGRGDRPSHLGHALARAAGQHAVRPWRARPACRSRRSSWPAPGPSSPRRAGPGSTTASSTGRRALAAPWWCTATRPPTSTARSAAWKTRICSRAIGWAWTAAAPAPASSPRPKSRTAAITSCAPARPSRIPSRRTRGRVFSPRLVESCLFRFRP